MQKQEKQANSSSDGGEQHLQSSGMEGLRNLIRREDDAALSPARSSRPSICQAGIALSSTNVEPYFHRQAILVFDHGARLHPQVWQRKSTSCHMLRALHAGMCSRMQNHLWHAIGECLPLARQVWPQLVLGWWPELAPDQREVAVCHPRLSRLSPL